MTIATDVRVANALFTVLTVLALVAVVTIAAVALASRVARPMRSGWTHLVVLLGPQARSVALVVAVVATAGSLYYSEVAGFVPCELCWYQRICMYPLVAILAVGVWRRGPAVGAYAGPLLVAGAPLSSYHWLVERVPAAAGTSSCSALVPCGVPYFQELGFVTLSFMCLTAFALVAALLIVDRAHARAAGVPGPARRRGAR